MEVPRTEQLEQIIRLYGQSYGARGEALTSVTQLVRDGIASHRLQVPPESFGPLVSLDLTRHPLSSELTPRVLSYFENELNRWQRGRVSVDTAIAPARLMTLELMHTALTERPALVDFELGGISGIPLLFHTENPTEGLSIQRGVVCKAFPGEMAHGTLYWNGDIDPYR